MLHCFLLPFKMFHAIDLINHWEGATSVHIKHELINKKERNLYVKNCIIFYADILTNARKTNFTKYIRNITYIYILLISIT